jgi:hypothetical protein
VDIESDKPVKSTWTRRGAYSITFESPEVSLTEITNIYLATERQTPSREFIIRFTLSVIVMAANRSRFGGM